MSCRPGSDPRVYISEKKRGKEREEKEEKEELVSRQELASYMDSSNYFREARLASSWNELQ